MEYTNNKFRKQNVFVYTIVKKKWSRDFNSPWHWPSKLPFNRFFFYEKWSTKINELMKEYVCYLAKYKGLINIFGHNPALGHNSSYCWHSIWNFHALLIEGLRWRIDDGTHINVWNRPWIRAGVDFRVHSLPPIHLKDLFHIDSESWNEGERFVQLLF